MMDLLGWGQWILIGILALVVIGPRDLPRVLYRLGQGMKRLKGMTSGLREEFEGMMRLEHFKALQEKDTSHPPTSELPPAPRRRPRQQKPRKATTRSKSPRPSVVKSSKRPLS